MNDPFQKPREQKLDPSLLRAASYRDLAHWLAILDLDTALCRADDAFLDWLARCAVDVRPIDEGGAVVRKGNGSFFFIDAVTLRLCEEQYREVRPYWLNPGDAPKDGSE